MTEHRRIPPHAVDRPALRLQLDAGVRAPLSLIVAPAGAGKTVLLSQWAQSRPDIAVAWFDITAADDSPDAFARRLVDGLTAVVPSFHPPSAPIEASENRLGEAFLEDFAGTLADAGTVVLVFDDLDRLSGTAILTDLWRLVDLLPRNAHAVFASRVDLQLGWSRHRLEHGLVELRQRELAFDDATTARVIERIAGKSVTDEAVAAVTARTEGWAVGVQLTALSLRFSHDPGRVVDTLADTDRLVVDYLSEEVLDALQPERRDALVRLAVLDEVSAGLVEAVADVDGAGFLAELERDSMFIVAVPGRPGWHRFHRLFRDLLLYRLRAADRHAEARLLEAAADWYLAEGEAETAVEYLLRARRWDRVLEHVLTTGRDVFEEVRTATVARWLRRLPPEVRAASADAELLLALTEAMSGRGKIAVDALQALLVDDTLTIGQRQVALAYLAAGVQFHPRTDLFVAAGHDALALLDEHPETQPPDLLGLTTRAILTYVGRGSLGRAHLFLGDLAEARRWLTVALDMAGFAYTPYRVHLLGSLAVLDALTGRLVSATELADEALETAREFDLLAHPAPGDAYLARAIVAIQRGEPDVGALALAEGELRAASNQRTQLMWVARLVSMLIDPSDDRTKTADPASKPPPLVRQAMVALAMRRTRLRGLPAPSSTPATSWSPVAFEEVAALLTDGHPGAAHARLAQLRFDPDPLVPIRTVEVELLLGWTCALEGRRARAREHLAAALALAEADWIVDPFVRAGPVVADLLEDLIGTRNEFARVVVSRIGAAVGTRDRKLVDELTPRELELLAFLPSRLTIADIAVRCFVSTNTIKTHLGHIYRKLGVSGRDAAIERALEIGLLDAREIARVG
ncbi:LuxR C-terminal-related transcriptional regulator [Microbacterium sp. CFBP9034]|uniref:LuxR C-terminal-related transcriptional regulator n=1 Tax=Microbacterium sp. CFBP9034 TaxID=3096540 RepID=UPI002A69C93D|nr:LuxR C-terminal-related transcriptional regulator [Microbacterium sp. CFBP9034]MDY0908248.1 LuxR C-terminal-related transcriptional regulator [Microbacterium sp. CFBP9034]